MTTRTIAAWRFTLYAGLDRNPIPGRLYGHANLTRGQAIQRVIDELVMRHDEFCVRYGGLALEADSVRLGVGQEMETGK